MLIASGIAAAVERLVEHLLVEKGLGWLVEQHLVLMGMDFPIWIWIVLALAALAGIPVAVQIAGLIAWWIQERDAAKNLPQRELR